MIRVFANWYLLILGVIENEENLRNLHVHVYTVTVHCQSRLFIRNLVFVDSRSNKFLQFQSFGSRSTVNFRQFHAVYVVQKMGVPIRWESIDILSNKFFRKAG